MGVKIFTPKKKIPKVTDLLAGMLLIIYAHICIIFYLYKFDTCKIQIHTTNPHIYYAYK